MYLALIYISGGAEVDDSGPTAKRIETGMRTYIVNQLENANRMLGQALLAGTLIEDAGTRHFGRKINHTSC